MTAEELIRSDLDSNASVVTDGKTQKKVYPNGPCPCGSGKKYMKCCGRAR